MLKCIIYVLLRFVYYAGQALTYVKQSASD